jgi:osmotically-inducible protein OsmY
MGKSFAALVTIALGLSVFAVGCSRRAPPTYTPQFKVGTPTNSSVVNSWEPNNQPLYTQPGVNSGKPYSPKPVSSERGFEPYDPLAAAVYAALNRDHRLETRYLSVSAEKGTVKISGVARSAAEESEALSDARSVSGVGHVVDEIKVTAR